MFRRQIFSLACLLSLLLCVATVVLSVRSYLAVDEVSRSSYYIAGALPANRVIVSAFGVIHAYKFSIGYADSSAPITHWIWNSRSADASLRQSLNNPLPVNLNTRFQIGSYGVAYSADEYGIVQAELRIPYWPFTVLFAFLPAIWFWHWIRRVGRIDYVCCKCGYELTGNTSGVCMECGTAISDPGKVTA